MLRFTLPAVLVLVLTLMPLVGAHTTVTTTDGKYFVTVGNLNEPVTTYTKTGLDLTLRANASGARGSGIPGAHLTLNATLIAPNNEEFTAPLAGQFGKPGSYSFQEPYHLTLAGEYFLRLTGRINQTEVNFAKILVGSGAVPAMEDTMFPDDVQNAKQLQDRITALEAKVTSLEADDDEEPEGNAPGFDGFSLVVLLAGVALLAARSRSKA
jgi:hypothetical protein